MLGCVPYIPPRPVIPYNLLPPKTMPYAPGPRTTGPPESAATTSEPVVGVAGSIACASEKALGFDPPNVGSAAVAFARLNNAAQRVPLPK